MSKKYFSVEEANAALTLVKPIVRDMVVKNLALCKLHEEIRKKEQTGYESEGERQEKIAKAQSLANEIIYHVGELKQVGCTMEDSNLGIIDFPCVYEGRVVDLCWQMGEPIVCAWHEFNAGLENRKLIDRSFKKGCLLSLEH